VAGILRQRLDGEVATRIRREGGDIDLRVQMDYGTESMETLRNIMFKSNDGALIRLASIAEFETSRAPREIVRKGQERVAYVMADLAEGVRLSQGIDAARGALADLNVPPRYALDFTGVEEQRREAFGNLGFALILSIARVFMVMAAIFESFLHPFLSMLTFPLAVVGVVIGLYLTGQTLNVMSIIGVVMLGGIVVNNAIVLLDCVNQVRSSAKEREKELTSRDTLVIGCSRRLRPVIMTSLTTMLGLLPMALGLGAGAELRQALSITVLAGLLTSTVLTLFVIPCAQSYLDSLAALVRRLFGRRHHAPAPVAE
jgi:HAE1 family hydrophobic/amphiphilic exporter-1